MKISIGMALQKGPWGGGNQFAASLSEYLRNRGFEVVHDLSDDNIDLILLTEPRKNSRSSAFTDNDVIEYLRFRNSNTLVVHRINECDERKGTEHVNKLLINANRCADHTVFIATWLKELFIRQGISPDTSSVILNGADNTIFHPDGFSPWNHSDQLKIVTHHWGGNWLKGFDIYRQLDNMLAEPGWKEKIAFTYIGRTPQDFVFKHARHIAPLSGKELADELRQHHLYVTASRNEPAGMHHIEGAMCGLPLLFIESGALPQYCNGFGVSFTPENFTSGLEEIMETYDRWIAEMPHYSNTAERMCRNYHDLIQSLIQRAPELIALRSPWPPPTLVEKSAFVARDIQKKISCFSKSIQKKKK